MSSPTRWSGAIAALAAVSLLSSCGVPLEGEEAAEAPVVSSNEEELIISGCTGSTSSWDSNSNPTMSTSVHVLAAGASDGPSQFARETLVIPQGTRRTTITTSPRIDSAAVTTYVASPLPAGWSEANITLYLRVMKPDGTVVCESTRRVLESWVTAWSDTRSLAAPTVFPMSCTFDHDTTGATLTAEIKMRGFGAVASGIPGEAHAQGFGWYSNVTQQHCTSMRYAWCLGEGSRLLSLDINGDGRTDHVCHSGASIAQNITPSTGVPDDVPNFTSTGFCAGSTEVLVSGDVNADGRDDLVCVNTATREVRVNLSSATNVYDGSAEITSVASTTSSCFQPLMADFNGDGRADLLCLNGMFAGTPSIELGNTAGTFTSPDFTVPACTILRATGLFFVNSGSYHAGDVNADGRADLVCHDGATGAGRLFVRHADTLGRFNGPIVSDIPGWCSHATSRFTMADANGDGRKDFMCLTANTGHVMATFASNTGTFVFGTDRSTFANFCIGGGSFTAVDYDNDNSEGLTCQQASPASITLLPGI